MAQHKAMKETIIEAETRRGEDFKIRLGIERETFKGRMYSDGPITVNFYSVEVERHDDYSNVWLWTKGGDIATKVAVDNHVGQRITAAAGRHGMVR